MLRSRALVLLFALTVTATSTHASQEEPVWFWFATCGGPALTLEVRLDSTILYKSSFPLCRAVRDSVVRQGQEAGHVEFSFRPMRPIVWTGYREGADRTGADQRLEGQLWQAGADSDVLLIGVVFSDAAGLHMNTIHIAHPAQRDETEIAEGLVVVTYPAESGEDKRR